MWCDRRTCPACLDERANVTQVFAPKALIATVERDVLGRGDWYVHKWSFTEEGTTWPVVHATEHRGSGAWVIEDGLAVATSFADAGRIADVYLQMVKKLGIKREDCE